MIKSREGGTMKKKKNLNALLVIGISIILFMFVSVFSFTSIYQLQGNAKVVNFDGIVRGATQKLIKMELSNAEYDDVPLEARDNLILRLDNILYALDTGDGQTEETKPLIKLKDETHSNLIKKLLVEWADLKNEIHSARDTKYTKTLFTKSEAYFVLANDTVFAAESYSEKQVKNSMTTMIILDSVIIVFILTSAILILNGFAARNKVEVLDKIAYLDPLTNLQNRAGCEKVIQRIKDSHIQQNLSIIMFDMNNLKTANDFIGHQGGDRILSNFAKILGEEAVGYGFIGRFGGDEFLGVFENISEEKTIEYLQKVEDRVNIYNSDISGEYEKISYAMGFVVDSSFNTGIDDMIYTADRNMYIQKREMKLKR
jgi:diguanylate cyclase (GGDEF)-like protein